MGNRQQIVDLLRLFASEEEQLDYEQAVPHVDVTAELVSMWFDDQYHPGQRYFDSSFSPAELAALEEFHQFYDTRVKELPKSQGTVRTWLASPVWRAIMAKAHHTLTTIGESASRSPDD